MSLLFERGLIGKSSKNVETIDSDNEDGDLEVKVSTLLEMFPQLTRKDSLEVSLHRTEAFCNF